jgi:lysophospholipase L1-like esterase
MYTRKLVIATLLIAFVAFAKPPRKIALVFIGDSITQGSALRNQTDSAPPALATGALKKRLKAEFTFSNQGRSGFTTVDFLPATNKAYPKVVAAAQALQTTPGIELLFSIMLGTNDSAEKGPNGSPVSPENYHANLQIIIDSLLVLFPHSKIVLNGPLWYSENTHNTSRYMAEGLARLQTYFPEIKVLVKENKKLHLGHVFLGDQTAFSALKKDSITLFKHETGRFGTFYLHPNEKGNEVLGEHWAMAIKKVL